MVEGWVRGVQGLGWVVVRVGWVCGFMGFY